MSDTSVKDEKARTQAFENGLVALVNTYSQENASGTPDWILGQYLLDCLAAWNRAVGHREAWYGRKF